MIARCSCGRVEYEATGRPILSLICYCDDCCRVAIASEALPGAGSVCDLEAQNGHATKDRVGIVATRGVELLKHHKLRDGSATSRVAASCCNSAMVMGFDDSRHWVPVYRVG